MLELGVKAEVEIYDTGHLGLMLDLLKKDLLTEPLQVSFVMGVKGGMPADPMLLSYLRARAAPEHELAGDRHRARPTCRSPPSVWPWAATRASVSRTRSSQAEGARHLQRPARRATGGRGEVDEPPAGDSRRGGGAAQAHARAGAVTTATLARWDMRKSQ